MNIDYLGKTYTTAEEKDIIEVFKEMLDDVGEATSLDVKKALRAKGFWVDQKAVSEAISYYVAYNPGVYLVTYENGHKVYQLDWSNSIPLSVSALGTTGPTAPKAKKAAKRGNYMAFSLTLVSKITGDAPVEIYNDVTRNVARYTYAKKYGVMYTDVTAKKINK